MTDWKDAPMDELPRCVDACERAYYCADPVFEGHGQWNCPRMFGVDYVTTVNPITREPCKKWKRKKPTTRRD